MGSRIIASKMPNIINQPISITIIIIKRMWFEPDCRALFDILDSDEYQAKL